MDYAFDVFVAVGLILSLETVIAGACARCPALASRRLILSATALLWCFTVFFKRYYLDLVMVTGDGATHEMNSREVASMLAFDWVQASATYFGVGNRGYQFALGIFYSLTGAGEIVVYAVNALLGFWGLLSFLEILCRITDCPRVRLWMIGFSCALPSAMFWSAGNMKEGPVLWGIGMMLRLFLKYRNRQAQEPIAWPLAGVMMVGFLRPHVAVIWLAAIAVGLGIRKMRIGIVVLSAVGLVGVFFALQYLFPQMINSVLERGLVETLEARYTADLRNFSKSGSQIHYSGGAPVPIVSGLLLILLRPLPSEINSAAALLAGLEIWTLFAIMCACWWFSRSRREVWTSPFMLTNLVAIALFSFQFSYMYNMGLMVRQRIQVIPALVSLAALPVVESSRQRRLSRSSSPRLGQRKSLALNGQPRAGPVTTVRRGSPIVS